VVRPGGAARRDRRGCRLIAFRRALPIPLTALLAVLATASCTEPPAPAETTGPLPAPYVYRGAGCTGRDRMAAFETLIGRPAAGIAEFTELVDWQHMVNSANWALGCWDGRRTGLSQAVPMLMQDGSGTTLRAGARGEYDRHFRDLGALLVAHGHADAFLRIGWEFNGDWYPWAAKDDPAAWKAYFRRIVAALRSVPGQRFRIVWNPAQGEQRIAPDRLYPGDDVVDVIGLDFYNQSWGPGAGDPAARWENLRTMPYGLDWLARFGREHRKPVALPEWGTGTRPDGHGGGDDPLFVAGVARWIAANDVAYHVYWDYDAGDFNGELSSGRQPRAAAAFRRAFAPRP
jgi:hypothetical protein